MANENNKQIHLITVKLRDKHINLLKTSFALRSVGRSVSLLEILKFAFVFSQLSGRYHRIVHTTTVFILVFIITLAPFSIKSFRLRLSLSLYVVRSANCKFMQVFLQICHNPSIINHSNTV